MQSAPKISATFPQLQFPHKGEFAFLIKKNINLEVFQPVSLRANTYNCTQTKTSTCGNFYKRFRKPPRMLCVLFVRFSFVLNLTGFGRTTIGKLSADPESGFPSKIRLTERLIGWNRQAVLTWLESKSTSGGCDENRKS